MFTLKLHQLRALFGTKRQTLIVLFYTLNNVKFVLFVRRRIGTRCDGSRKTVTLEAQ